MGKQARLPSSAGIVLGCILNAHQSILVPEVPMCLRKGPAALLPSLLTSPPPQVCLLGSPPKSLPARKSSSRCLLLHASHTEILPKSMVFRLSVMNSVLDPTSIFKQQEILLCVPVSECKYYIMDTLVQLHI